MQRIETPAERFASASRKFYLLYIKHFDHNLFKHVRENMDGDYWLAIDNITNLFSYMAKEYGKLSHMAEVIDRENKRLCNHLALVPRKRETREKEWKAAQMTTTDTPARTFHRLLDLPPELRLLVWEAAAQPPDCRHVVAILDEARKPTKKYPMPEKHYDLAGLLYAGEDAGMWTACRESRMVVARVHDENRRRLAQMPTKPRPPKGVQEVGCCSYPVNTVSLEMQGRRVGRFNRAGIKLQRQVCYLDACLKVHYLVGEHILRRHILRPMAAPAGVVIQQQQQENFMVSVLRELYEVQGELPQRANEGPIPMAALKKLCPDLRIEYLLGLPWAK